MTTADKVTTTTTGTGTSATCQCPYIKPKAEQGWECPRCGRINAPWVRQCDCSRSNLTITSDWVNKPEWWKEITCNPDTFRIHPESGPIWKAPSSTCESNSATVSKSDPNIVYTHITNTDSIVGGSDYWDPNLRTTLKNN